MIITLACHCFYPFRDIIHSHQNIEITTPALCSDPLSFRQLSDIVFKSPIFSTAPRYRVQIPYRFGGSPASCADLLSFWRLSNIVSGSPIFSATLQHRVRISYHFSNSSASHLDPLVINHCDPTPLVFGIVMQGQNCWPLISSLEFIFTHHRSRFVLANHSFIHSIKEGHICRPSILSLDTCMYLGGVSRTQFLYVTAMEPLLGSIGFRTSRGFTYGSI